MNLIQWLKGVFSKMLGRESVEQVLKVAPVVSDKMRQAIELWEHMYRDEAPWLDGDKVFSLGLPSLIASEKARMATIELEVKITGNGNRAQFMKDTFKQVTDNIRTQLEYGIALGGFVIKPYVVKGVDEKPIIKFTYTKACDFYPLSFSADGQLTSAAFVDRIVKADKVYSKFEVHSLENNIVVVQNRVFVADNKPNVVGMQDVLGSEISITSVPEWSNIEPRVEIKNMDTLLFAYFKTPEANTVDTSSPLGVSGYSRAVGLIQKADEQYSNLLWEFEGGQLAIDVDRTALNPIKYADGKEKLVLPKLQDRLFRRHLDLGEDDMYNVYSPDLRDKSILNGLNNILIHIEDACSLARGTLSDVAISEARTATELKILKQRAFSANADIQNALENTFKQVFKIMEIYCELYNIVSSDEYEVAYHWDDSILVDKDTERQVDLLDVERGLMSKVEYRMKWKGETRKQAEESLAEIQKEQQTYIEMQQKMITQKEADQKVLERANESGESTTPKKE